MPHPDSPSALPSIAVLLAAYNGERWVEEQLDTIFSQTAVNVHVFLSLDYSTDDSCLLIEKYASRESRLSLLPYGELYGSAARNFFRLLRDADISGFDYVAFADQDDVWLPEKLSRAVECLQKGYDGYSSDVTAFWPDGRQKLIKKSQPQKQWDFLFESPGPGCTFVMSAQFVSQLQLCVKQNWADLQQFDYHDWFVYAFARSNGFNWVIDQQPGILYRQHASNVVGANTGVGAFCSRAKYVLRGGAFSQAILLTHLLNLGDQSFVRIWSSRKRFGYLRLALRAGQCRRNRREQVYFFLLCVLGVIYPS
jgi:rhamnosyltransferase